MSCPVTKPELDRTHAGPFWADTLFIEAFRAIFACLSMASSFDHGDCKVAQTADFFDGIGETVPRFEEAGRGGFMRRFLTLVCLLCVAISAGISISGCTRNPAGNYCNGLGYGWTHTNVASIFLTPQTTGTSLAFGLTQQIASPT